MELLKSGGLTAKDAIDTLLAEPFRGPSEQGRPETDATDEPDILHFAV